MAAVIQAAAGDAWAAAVALGVVDRTQRRPGRRRWLRLIGTGARLAVPEVALAELEAYWAGWAACGEGALGPADAQMPSWPVTAERPWRRQLCEGCCLYDCCSTSCCYKGHGDEPRWLELSMAVAAAPDDVQ